GPTAWKGSHEFPNHERDNNHPGRLPPSRLDLLACPWRTACRAAVGLLAKPGRDGPRLVAQRRVLAWLPRADLRRLPALAAARPARLRLDSAELVGPGLHRRGHPPARRRNLLLPCLARSYFAAVLPGRPVRADRRPDGLAL